jgi:hypothetical protein
LVIFLFECADRDDSTFLKRLALSRAKEEARVTLTQGRVFCLVVGRSFIGDVESYETPESIQRFREPIDQVLRSGLANPQ